MSNPIKTRIKQYFEGDSISFGETGKFYKWVQPFNARTREYQFIEVTQAEFDLNKETTIYSLQSIVIEKNDIGCTNLPTSLFVTHNFNGKSDPDKIIGDARIWRDEDTGHIMADIDLFTTVNKHIPQGSIIWPAVGGMVEEREGNKITKYKLTEVSFCTVRNVDDRIPSLQL